MITREWIYSYDSDKASSFWHFIARNIRELSAYRFALRLFVVNNIRTRYRRSVLGLLWSLLNPFFFMIILAVVFSSIFRQDIRTFSVYVFSGLLPWMFINASFQAGSLSVVYAEGYIKKIYIPKVLFPIVTITTEAVNFLFSLISLFLLSLLLGSAIKGTVILLPLAILILYLFNLGWGMLVSVFTVYFRDLTQIITVLFTALFYTVPIVYPLEVVPEGLRNLLQYNPLIYYINLFRGVIYSSEPLSFTDWAIPIAFSLAALGLGLLSFYWRDRDLIYRL